MSAEFSAPRPNVTAGIPRAIDILVLVHPPGLKLASSPTAAVTAFVAWIIKASSS